MKPFFRAIAFALVALTAAAGAPRVSAATVNVTYTDGAAEGFNDSSRGAARRTAFESAIGLWGSRITSSVAIKVTAHFDPMGGTANSATLATCGPTSVFRDWGASATQPVASTWYPAALANKLAGSDLDTSSADLDVRCNSDVDNSTVLGTDDWYYGLDGNAGSDVDFFSTVLHELGHGLGFISFISSDGSFAVDGINPGIYDRFMQSGAAGSRTSLTAMTKTQRQAALISNQLVFNGTQTNASNGGLAAKLYAPTTFEGGSSTSHLDEDTFSGNNECMTPLASGVAQDPGPVVTGIFRDMGWIITSGDVTPPSVTCSSPTAGTLTGFTQAGAGTATDVHLIPQIQVHLRLDSEDFWWGNGGWFTTTATRVQDSPQVPSSFNPSTGAWSVALSAWPDSFDIFDHEDYTLFVIASDTAGNQTTLTRSIRIDQNPPVVAFSPLVQGATVADLSGLGGSISQSSSVTFQIAEANAPAADRFWTGSAFGSNAAVFQSGAISGSTWNRGSSVLPTSAQLREGPFRLTVRATNSFGTIVEKSITVTVSNADTIKPVASFTSPLNGSAVRGLASVQGLASDNQGGSGMAKVGFFLRRNSDLLNWNGTAWVSSAFELPTTLAVNSLSQPTWRCTKMPTTTNLLDGSYRATAVPRDVKGNVGTSVVSTFTLDRAAPTVVITSPANAAKTTTLLSVSGTTADTLTGGAAGTGVTSVKLTLQRLSDSLFWNGSAFIAVASGAKPPALTTTLSGSSWTRTTGLPTVALLLPGNYALTATAVDKAVNTTVVSSGFTVIADTVVPILSITNPASGATFTSLSPFNGTASDPVVPSGGTNVPGSGVERVNLILRRASDNRTWTGSGWSTSTITLAATITAGSGSNVNWSFGAAGTPSATKLPTGANLLPGTYTLSATSVDRAANTSVLRSRNFSVVAAAASTAATSPIVLSNISANTDGAITLIFTGSLAGSSTDTSRYNATTNGTVADIGSAQQTNSSTIVLTTEQLVAGVRLEVTYDLLDLQGRRVAGTAVATVKSIGNDVRVPS